MKIFHILCVSAIELILTVSVLRGSHGSGRLIASNDPLLSPASSSSFNAPSVLDLQGVQNDLRVHAKSGKAATSHETVYGRNHGTRIQSEAVHGESKIRDIYNTGFRHVKQVILGNLALHWHWNDRLYHVMYVVCKIGFFTF